MWAYNQTAPDELYHHGIIGMHWGIRRYQNADGSNIRPKKQPKARRESRKNRVQKMSDNDLRAITTRKDLERKYKQQTGIHNAIAIVGTTAAALGTLATFYANSGRIIDIGKKAAKAVTITTKPISEVIGDKKVVDAGRKILKEQLSGQRVIRGWKW